MHQLWFDHYNSCDFISSYMNFVLQENQDLLIKCVSQDLGFSSGKPIAACLIYRCLLHWRSFEVERTGVFDRIIQTIGSAIEVMNCACLFDFTPFFSQNYTLQFSCLVYSDYELVYIMLLLYNWKDRNNVIAATAYIQKFWTLSEYMDKSFQKKYVDKRFILFSRYLWCCYIIKFKFCLSKVPGQQ